MKRKQRNLKCKKKANNNKRLALEEKKSLKLPLSKQYKWRMTILYQNLTLFFEDKFLSGNKAQIDLMTLTIQLAFNLS